MLTAGTKLYDTDLFMWFDASQQATGSDATFRTHDLKALGNTTQTAVCSSSFTISEGVGLRNVGAIDAYYNLTGTNGVCWIAASPDDHLNGGTGASSNTHFTDGDEITVECWLYLTTGWNTGQITDGGGSANRISQRDKCSFRIKESASSYFQCGSAYWQPNLTDVDGTNYVSTVMSDKWAHYVWRFGDGSVLDESGSDKGDFWINGNKVTGTTTDPNISGMTHFSRITINTTNLAYSGPESQPGTSDRLTGRLGMLRFYKKAIPASAVRSNYAGTKARWGL
jgi:hypothetical protein